MPGEHELILRPELTQQPTNRFQLTLKQKYGRLEQAVVNEPDIEHLHSEPIVEENLVVVLVDEIEAANSEDDLAVVSIGVDDVRRASAVGLVIGNALDEPVGVHAVSGGKGEAGSGEVGLVDGEDGAGDAGDGFKIVGDGRGP